MAWPSAALFVRLNWGMILDMAKIERIREAWSRPITAEFLAEQASFGWKLVSVVWEREIEPDAGSPSPREEEAPYGLRVAADGLHLEENTAELEVLLVIMEGICSGPSDLTDSGRTKSPRLPYSERIEMDSIEFFWPAFILPACRDRGIKLPNRIYLLLPHT
jgi:hypothetical protein